MARIKIKDISYDRKISKEELREIAGGTYFKLSVPSFFGFKSAQYMKYHSTTEGAGYQSDLPGIEATQHDSAPAEWTNGDESSDS